MGGMVLFIVGVVLRRIAFEEIGSNVIGCAGVFSVSLPSLLSTLWIPHKLMVLNQKYDQALVSPRAIEMSATRSDVSMRYHGAFHMELLATLKNEQQFERFIQFMFRDFSSEAMLGFIEMVQFKECFVKEMQFNEELDCIYMHSLYENVPKSSIVYNS